MNAVSPSNPLYRARRRRHLAMMVLSALMLGFGLVWLVWILATLLYEGGTALLRASFYLHMTPPPGSDGGLANAIVGSLIIVGVGTLLGTPVGILAGTYLAEFGKRSRLDEFPVQGRGGQGVIGIRTSERNGRMVGALQVEPDHEVILITSAGTLVRTAVSEISEMGRSAQGVRLIRLDSGDSLVGMQRVETLDEEPYDGDDGDDADNGNSLST